MSILKTAGYDFVAEINEILVNRALAAAFYTTTIPERVKGSYTPPDAPPALSTYSRIDYELSLKEPPTVDAFSGNIVRILFNAEVVLNVLGGLRLEFDVTASVEASPTYDQASRKLTIDLKNSRLDTLAINDEYELPQDVLNKFNEAISAALRTDILDEVETIDVVPILYSLELPDMPPGPANRLTIGLGNIKILNQSVMAACINFLGYTGGDITQVTDFSVGLDFCSGFSEAAMHRIFDFWWARTTHPKSGSASGRYDIEAVDDVLDTLADIGIDLTTKLASLGFVETDVSVDESWLEYSATVMFGKPSFDLKNGNMIEVTNCPLQIDAEAKVKLKVSVEVQVDTSGLIPDWLTPWEDDITISRKTSTLTLASFSINNLNVNIDRAVASVYLDDQNRLMAKVEEVDITIDLPWSLPETIINWIIDQIEGLIKGRFPAIPLSPALITEEVPGTTLTLEVDIDKLETNEDEAIVGASVAFKNMVKTVIPVPKFIANRDPLSREVHRAYCQWVDEIWEKNKVGYYVLLEALRDGYDGCAYCLPEYHRR